MADDFYRELKGFVMEELDTLAEQIEADMQDMVAPHSASGSALAAIHIEKPSELTRFIGADIKNKSNDGGLHLYFLDQGNGKGGIPKNGRKPRRPMPITYGYPGQPHGFAMHVSNYDGIGFIDTIAKKYGG